MGFPGARRAIPTSHCTAEIFFERVKSGRKAASTAPARANRVPFRTAVVFELDVTFAQQTGLANVARGRKGGAVLKTDRRNRKVRHEAGPSAERRATIRTLAGSVLDEAVPKRGFSQAMAADLADASVQPRCGNEAASPRPTTHIPVKYFIGHVLNRSEAPSRHPPSCSTGKWTAAILAVALYVAFVLLSMIWMVTQHHSGRCSTKCRNATV